MKAERVEIEIYSCEFEALKANRMISDMCGRYLKSVDKRGDYVVLDLSIQEANDLAGWVAAEANHAKSDQESELLNSACDAIEANI
jgi:hypothetical protein